MIESELNSHIIAFAKKISTQPLEFAIHLPEQCFQTGMCFGNVHLKIQKKNGIIKFGWMFVYRQLFDFPPGYLIAQHHAIWQAPNNQLIDVTPFHNNPKHHPHTSNNNVLFLPDENALPKTNLMLALPSQFYALNNHPKLARHLTAQREKEELECSNVYEINL